MSDVATSEPRARRARARFQFQLPAGWSRAEPTPPADPRFVPIVALAGRAAELVDHYLRLPRLTCCSFRAGYRVFVDDRWWLEGVDEPWMSMNWVRACSELLVDATAREVKTFVWEESRLQLRREDDWLRLVDDAAPTVYPPVWVPLRPFARDLWLGARAFERLANEIAAEVARRGGTPEKLAELRQHNPARSASPAQTELEKLSQIELNFARARVDLHPLRDFLGVI
ncbi:MAG: hypothetical protein JST54_20010 [Deltaproteobacteria bacterium]|nr:hypothetical protein [Deltaproteobacteria bacterium]